MDSAVLQVEELCVGANKTSESASEKEGGSHRDSRGLFGLGIIKAVDRRKPSVPVMQGEEEEEEEGALAKENRTSIKLHQSNNVNQALNCSMLTTVYKNTSITLQFDVSI